MFVKGLNINVVIRHVTSYIAGITRKIRLRFYRHPIISTFIIFTLLLLSSPYLIFSYIHLTDVKLFLNKQTKTPCVFPKFNFYDKSINKYFWQPDPIKCGKWLDLVYVDSNSILKINETAVTASGHIGVQCYYSPIYTKHDVIINFNTETVYKIPGRVTTEFCRVRCKDQTDETIYENIYWSMNYKNGSNQRKYLEETRDQLSVFIYGMESTCKLIAERQFPKTLKYIREDLNGYILKGYTQVGDGTFQNTQAFLTGITPNTIELNHSVNEIPYIWNNFSAKGYVSLYSEDRPEMQTLIGFLKPPTDHYARPYHLAQMELKSLIGKMLFVPLSFLHHNNIKVTDSSSMCYGNTPIHVRILQYWRQFVQNYGKKLKFSYVFNSGLTHDFFNFGQLADKDICDVLKWMKDNGKLQNAVLILLGDHGQRFSELRHTEIGRQTHSMPFCSIVLPTHFKERYPHIHRNLIRNTERLTTHYDMFETLKDILHKNFAPREPLRDGSQLPRGISLFREVPKSRSCFDAGVSENLCSCSSAKNISVDTKKVKDIAVFLINKINNILGKYPMKCKKLTLTRVQSARLIYANYVNRPEFDTYFNIRKLFHPKVFQLDRYSLIIKAEPCGGEFEGMVQVEKDGSLELMGMINRVNIYGKQSICMSERLMRLYCCCYSFLSHD